MMGESGRDTTLKVEKPATVEELRSAWGAVDARLAALGRERLTLPQLERWLASIEGRPVRVSAPAFCALPAPLEASGILSPPIASEHPDWGVIRCYELAGPAVAAFFIAPGAIVRADREYVDGNPTVDLAMRIESPLTTYRLRITATLAEVNVDA
jgi:hypothetical protein